MPLLATLKKNLRPYGITIERSGYQVSCLFLNRSFEFLIAGASFDFEANQNKTIVSADTLYNNPEKILSIILSKLGANHRIFARSCEVKKIDKQLAEDFLNKFHIMGATQSGSNLGLFRQDELVAVASFSKGRKMDRLPNHLRSFEMIRFCCKSGITVTGGLTKLVKNFYREKGAGDIMTYVDKQLSDGSAFKNAGFRLAGTTEPNFFLVEKKTLIRTALKNKDIAFDHNVFYLSRNNGNIKMIYSPFDKI